MPENLMDSQGATVLTAIIVVAIALLALVGVFWLIRNRAASTFIRGGKNRQPRLAVLDATAVDTRRRLVLIRRDDVEHLVMIGGPTDIVIESGIPQAQTGRRPQQPDQTASPPPQQQRPGHAAPAARAAAPHQPPVPSSPDNQPAAAPTDRAFGQPDAGPRPSPRQRPQQPAAMAAVAGTAAATRTEAAELLETARTRVFEEPEFDAADLEDLIAVPQSAPQAAPPRPQPTASAAPTSPPRNTPAAAGADPIQAEAADVLETARTRVFEEPTFDGDVFDQLTADVPDQELPAPAMRATATRSEPSASRAQTPPAAPESTEATSDFETILAAELSEDPDLGSPRESLITAQYHEHQFATQGDDQSEAPEVKPEPQQSRDSLEAEMEKLLGDLSRK